MKKVADSDYATQSLGRGPYYNGRDPDITPGAPLGSEVQPTDFKDRQHQDLFGGKNPA